MKWSYPGIKTASTQKATPVNTPTCRYPVSGTTDRLKNQASLSLLKYTILDKKKTLLTYLTASERFLTKNFQMQNTKKNDDPRRLELSCLIPPQFLLLCKLMEVEPHEVVRDFMCNIGMENYGLGEQQRLQAMEYFIGCGYGQDFYIEADLRKIMKEMEAISSLFPYDGSHDFIDLHARWRDRYYNYWFQKWFKKVRRKQ